mgnify:CR=1 FL=1
MASSITYRSRHFFSFREVLERTKTMTSEHLAKILYEEFERDGWGDIDPYLFRYVFEGDTDAEYAADMKRVLDRVVARLKKPAK